MCCDSGQPPIAILRRALTSATRTSSAASASGGTRWIALRTDKKPFDNLNVRKAVIAAFDREALLLTRGGREVGPIAQGYIPPGVAGLRGVGRREGVRRSSTSCSNPKGDPELAKQYMLKAKAEGVPVDRRRPLHGLGEAAR